MKVLRFALAFFIALLIVLAIYTGIFFYTEEKRKRLVEAYDKFFKERGRQIPTQWFKRQLDKLGNKDLNVLIAFSKALESKNKLDAILLSPQVLKVLTEKTELNNIEGIDEIFRNVELTAS